MRPFSYARPKSVEEAIELLGQDGATPLAGGTDLLSLLKSDIERASLLVGLKGVAELRGTWLIDDHSLSGGNKWQFGAATTLEELRTSDLVQSSFPALADALAEHRSPQIRAMGTLGGDLCQRPRCWYYRSGFGLLAQRHRQSMPEAGDGRYHSIFDEGAARFVSASRLAPALIAHNAKVRIQGPSEARWVKLEDFFRVPRHDDEREIDLAPGEIVTRVQINAAEASAQYEVHPRRALDWPLSAAAVSLRKRQGEVVGVRVVLGHVAPRPRVVEGALAVLRESPSREEAAAAIGDLAVADAQPLADNRYKVQMTRTAVRRALTRAFERLA